MQKGRLTCSLPPIVFGGAKSARLRPPGQLRHPLEPGAYHSTIRAYRPLRFKNEQIQLVNFWPNMELNEYINLESRVKGKMVLLDISATGEENLIEMNENDEMTDLEYRRKQLEQLQSTVLIWKISKVE